MNKFAQRLKETIKTNNLSQTKIAKEFNTTQQTVSRWVNGESQPGYDILYKLCVYLNVSADYLLGISDY
ncbi:MAG: helix-turn-helix transcriptional regulator [Clostridia bacterium]|nr:helix-turn-helix transcriptional regulator [Clostridia bacterium]